MCGGDLCSDLTHLSPVEYQVAIDIERNKRARERLSIRFRLRSNKSLRTTRCWHDVEIATATEDKATESPPAPDVCRAYFGSPVTVWEISWIQKLRLLAESKHCNVARIHVDARNRLDVASCRVGCPTCTECRRICEKDTWWFWAPFFYICSHRRSTCTKHTHMVS